MKMQRLAVDLGRGKAGAGEPCVCAKQEVAGFGRTVPLGRGHHLAQPRWNLAPQPSTLHATLAPFFQQMLHSVRRPSRLAAATRSIWPRLPARGASPARAPIGPELLAHGEDWNIMSREVLSSLVRPGTDGIKIGLMTRVF